MIHKYLTLHTHVECGSSTTQYSFGYFNKSQSKIYENDLLSTLLKYQEEHHTWQRIFIMFYGPCLSQVLGWRKLCSSQPMIGGFVFKRSMLTFFYVRSSHMGSPPCIHQRRRKRRHLWSWLQYPLSQIQVLCLKFFHS